MPRTEREATLTAVTDDIVAVMGRGVTFVAVDGVDGAGKTHFADELASLLGGRGFAVIRASVDGFHNPAHVRYEQGRGSPEGFFHDSYDYDALRTVLLDPLRDGDDRRFVRAVYDVHREAAVEHAVETAPGPAVLIFDGIFLHRSELRTYWHYSVFLDVDFAISIPRGVQRGYGEVDPSATSNRRYVEGQRLYLRECRPREHATVVIDNNDLHRATITRRTSAKTDAEGEMDPLKSRRLGS